jgi:tetratricopeptide (TPR) repeat protein
MPISTTARLVLALGLLALGAFGSPGTARADPADPTPDERAVSLFQRSEDSYKAGRFDESIALLREAYALKPEPVLLFNLGRCYEAKDDLPDAIDAYGRYLARAPDKDRPAVERRLTTLRRQLVDREALEARHQDELRRLANAQLVERARLSEARRGATLLLPKVIVGTGGAGLVAGAVFAGLALARQSAAESEPSQLNAEQDLQTGRTFATGANVAFVAGGVLVAAGVVWWIVAARTPHDERSRSAGAPLAWTF